MSIDRWRWCGGELYTGGDGVGGELYTGGGGELLSYIQMEVVGGDGEL